MKKFKIIISVAVFAIMLISSGLYADGKKEVKEIKFKTSAVCHKCEAKIEDNMKYEKGVKFVDLNVDTKICVIKYRVDKTSPEKLKKALEKLGYEVSEIKKNKEGKEALEKFRSKK